MKLSTYQQAILDELPKATNLIIEAKAGSGKTTTLIKISEALIGSQIFLAFSSTVAATIRKKTNIEARTINSLGNEIVIRNKAGAYLNNNKYYCLASDLIAKNNLSYACLDPLIKLTGLAQCELVRNKEEVKECIEHFNSDITKHLTLDQSCNLVMSLLKEGINKFNSCGEYSFNDQVWLPSILKLKFNTYDHVLVDEAQDLNKAQLSLILRIGKRFIFCGDSNQCQPGDTMITLADGSKKKLELIKAGDSVVSYNSLGEDLTYSTVTDIKEEVVDRLYKIKVADTINLATANHKWLVSCNDADICANSNCYFKDSLLNEERACFEIKTADLVKECMSLPIIKNGRVEWNSIESIEEVETVTKVYSLNVSKYHTYIANGVITKNSIMGFSGADCNSMEHIRSTTNAVILPLSICYRCPNEHLEVARKIVPSIENGSNVPGVLKEISFNEMLELVQDGDAVLCRNNAPLIYCAFKIINEGKKVNISGVDTSPICKIINSLDSDDINRSLLRWKQKASKSDIRYSEDINEIYQCILDCWECLGRINSRKELADKISHIKSRKGIILSSIHKSKGLEYERVFVLNINKMPLKWKNQKSWQLQQEINLKYVALTRSKENLYLVKA